MGPEEKSDETSGDDDSKTGICRGELVMAWTETRGFGDARKRVEPPPID